MSQEHKNANVAASRPEAEDTPAKPHPQGAVGNASKQSDNQGEVEVPLVGHDELEGLQRELEQALSKANAHWDLYLKATAEMENLRKRTARDVQNAHKFALERFVLELLPVKDSLEMGIAAADEADDMTKVAKLREGSALTLKMLTAAMEKFGVREVNPLGEKFNPEFHEAMAMQPSAQAQPNTILHVVQKGYLLNDRLIRPAMVIVAQAGQKPDSGVENSQDTPTK